MSDFLGSRGPSAGAGSLSLLKPAPDNHSSGSVSLFSGMPGEP